MKAKDLIKILQSVHPESDVFFSIGKFEEEEKRDIIAKSQLVSGNDPLTCLEVVKAEIVSRDPIDDEDTYGADLILDTFVYPSPQGLWDDAEDFDKLYKKQD